MGAVVLAGATLLFGQTIVHLLTGRVSAALMSATMLLALGAGATVALELPAVTVFAAAGPLIGILAAGTVRGVEEWYTTRAHRKLHDLGVSASTRRAVELWRLVRAVAALSPEQREVLAQLQEDDPGLRDPERLAEAAAAVSHV